MSKSAPVLKKEEGQSPSLRATAKTDSDFPLPPSSLPVNMADPVKEEEPLKKEDRFSPSLSSSFTVELEPKAETRVWPSQTLLFDNGAPAPSKPDPSPTPTPPPLTASASGTTSMSSTPPPSAANNFKKGRASPVQLIGDLPVARLEALASFNEIIENNYQYKSLGRSREALESMTCDCVYEHGIHDIDDACGPESDCINRLTQVECLPDDCRCKAHCRNQRFQKRQYADIEIVLTEKKGYGLRAEVDLPRDTFIYEYVGDVVNPVSFKKRMRDYAKEGIQHFYFMMLQKDEFIDATKSGGKGRFANHSCKPNCYVAKWTVGQHVRMGIFAKRDIKKHEELTFNYNVDRYGHQAQTCYCGESNCVGHIGGKTQTDIAAMDDLYLDALGITDEADLLELKGTKKKKGKKIDDPDFMPTMKPLLEKDVPKIVQAIRQTQSRKMLFKFLTRIKITEDQAALRQIMRLRGYSVMTNVLGDYASDAELMTLILESINKWPLVNRNKVEDSKVGVPVKAIAEKEDLPQPLRDLAQSLLTHWESLPLYNRIPKRVKTGDEEHEEIQKLYSDDEGPEYDARQSKRFRVFQEYRETKLSLAPIVDRISPDDRQSRYIPAPPKPDPFSRASVRAVIAAAAEAKAAEALKAEEDAKVAEAAAAEAAAKAAAREERRKSKAMKKAQTQEEKDANKEKRLVKLVGPIVVHSMSRYAKSLGHDVFKKHAKELTQLIVDKEKKSQSYKESRLDQLSEEKVAKIKKFAKEYINKILYKMKKSGHRARAPSSSATQATPTSTATPNSTDGVDIVMADMTVEEVLDMESGSEGEEEEMENEGGGSTSSSNNALQSPPTTVESSGSGDPAVGCPMTGLDEQHFSIQTPSDPRRRPPVDGKDCGWELLRPMDVLPATS